MLPPLKFHTKSSLNKNNKNNNNNKNNKNNKYSKNDKNNKNNKNNKINKINKDRKFNKFNKFNMNTFCPLPFKSAEPFETRRTALPHGAKSLFDSRRMSPRGSLSSESAVWLFFF